jgi:hypothetical protein
MRFQSSECSVASSLDSEYHRAELPAAMCGLFPNDPAMMPDKIAYMVGGPELRLCGQALLGPSPHALPA